MSETERAERPARARERPERVVVLGPQRKNPTLIETARSLGLGGGPFAVITAGWEEREAVDRELLDHLGGRARNLELFFRTQEVLQHDPELFGALQRFHDRVRTVRDLYASRLHHAAEAAVELLERRPRAQDPEGLAIEENDLDAGRQDAIEALRRLDDDHLRRMREIRVEFDRSWRPRERDALARQRRELRDLLDDVPCVCIAGGHVAVQLENLRFFGIDEMLGGRTLIAWSAGAMALTERVILFHDNPPQGAGRAEAFDEGLGLAPEFVALPDARKRLRLEDPVRVQLFARRFGPALCMALDAGARAEWDGRAWTVAAGSRRLTEFGTIEEMAHP